MAGFLRGWLGRVTGTSIGGLGGVPPANPAPPQFTHPAQNIGMQGATAMQAMMQANTFARQQMQAAAQSQAAVANSLHAQFNQQVMAAMMAGDDVVEVPMPETVGFTPIPLTPKGQITMRLPKGAEGEEFSRFMLTHLGGKDAALCTLDASMHVEYATDSRLYRVRLGAKVALPTFTARQIADLRYVTSMFKVPCQLAVLLMLPRDKLAGMFASALRTPPTRNITAVLDGCSNELVWQANDQLLTHGWTYDADDTDYKLYAPVVHEFSGRMDRGLYTDTELYDMIASDVSNKLCALVRDGKAYTKDHPMEWHAAKLEELMK